jgi:hypothetical protein
MTGLLQEDYIQGVDENGNIQFSSEIEDLVSQYDDTIADQQEQLMANLRFQAAAQGVSERDMVFTDTMNAWIDDATMQSATHIAETLKQDLAAGYDSMANSIMNMLKGRVTDAVASSFAEQIAAAKEEALKDYEAQMQMLAEQAAARKGAGIANIFQGLISAAATAVSFLI